MWNFILLWLFFTTTYKRLLNISQYKVTYFFIHSAAVWGEWKEWIGCTSNPCVGEHRCRFRYCGDVVGGSLNCVDDADDAFPLSLSCDQQCEVCTAAVCNVDACELLCT